MAEPASEQQLAPENGFQQAAGEEQSSNATVPAPSVEAGSEATGTQDVSMTDGGIEQSFVSV